MVREIANELFGAIIVRRINILNDRREIATRGKEVFETGFSGVNSRESGGTIRISEEGKCQFVKSRFTRTGISEDM